MSIKQMVRMATYAGKRVYRGEVISDASWEALVDDDLWARATAVIDSNTLTHSGDSTARWLLSGIARCGQLDCGGPMRRQKNGNTNAYLCKWCRGTGRVVERTDDTVTRKLLALLATAPKTNSTDPTPALLDARREAKALRDRLDEFRHEAIAGRLSAASLAMAEQELLPQIRTSEAKARNLAAPMALAGYDLSDPVALWKSLDVDGRRTLLRRAVRVTIRPAGRSHVWRDDLIEVTPTWS